MISKISKQLFLLLFINILFAGKISFSGKIMDNSSNQPIQNANIMILDSNKGTVSNEDGYFSIKLKDKDTLTYKIEHIGYRDYKETLTTQVKTEINKTIYLKNKTEKFNPVMITARGYRTKIDNISGSVGIISQEQVGQSNPLGIADIAEFTPGINKSSDMPWGSDLNIRGLSNKKIVVLVNGNRISTATAIPSRFGTVSTQDVERVEILKGPLSVQYGTGSIGGVVNIITKQGQFGGSGWNFEINNSYESIANGISSYGRVNYSSDNFYFSLSQSYRNYNDYEAGENINIPNSQFTDYQTNLNFGYKINDQNSLEFQGQYLEARNVGIPGGGDQFPAEAKAIYPYTWRGLLGLTWNHEPEIEIWGESKVKLYYQPIHRGVDLEPQSIKKDTINNGNAVKYIQPQLVQPRADHYVVGGKWQNYFEINKHNITAGIESWQREYNGKRTRNIQIDMVNTQGDTLKSAKVQNKDKPLPDSKYRPIGLFIEDEYNLNDKFTLNFGIRMDQILINNDRTYMSIKPPSDSIRWAENEDIDYSYSFQSGLVYAITSNFDLNFLVGRSFRSPSLEERYQYIDLGSIVKLGDPELDSEKSWFFETGVDWIKPNLHWKSNIFLNLTRDLLIDRPCTYRGKDALIKTNAGKARLYGFDTNLNWFISKKFNLAGNIAYTKGYDTEKDQYLPSIPPLHMNISAHYDLMDNIWGEVIFKGAAEKDNISPGETETPGYSLVDIKGGSNSIKFLSIDHKLTVGVKNIFDKKYRRHLTKSRGFELYEPGRSFFIKWGVKL